MTTFDLDRFTSPPRRQPGPFGPLHRLSASLRHWFQVRHTAALLSRLGEHQRRDAGFEPADAYDPLGGGLASLWKPASNPTATQPRLHHPHFTPCISKENQAMQQNYTTSITVEQSPEQVLAAVADVRGWWSQDVEGNTTKPGDVWYYHARDLHRCTIKVVESVPGHRIAWRILDNYFNFTEDKSEWIGTTMVFEVEPADGGTRLIFTHVGLVPDYECYEVCHDAWGIYIRGSLKSLIATGKGYPNVGPVITAEQAATPGPSFTSSFTVAASPEAAFAAITNPRAWWSGAFEGGTDKLGDEFTYRYKGMHFSRQRVAEMAPGRRVAWEVLESELSFLADKSEWTGTTIAFDISRKGDATEVVFTHVGLKPAVECYDVCTDAWTSLIQGSLKQLIETGRTELIELEATA